MNVLSASRNNDKQWVPILSNKTAEQRKNSELYGSTVSLYGTNKKKDGQLIAHGADWRNPTNAPFNAPENAKRDFDSPAKEKKHTHLQSSILSFEDPKSRPGLYSPEKADKIMYGSMADWSTQAGTARVNNKSKRLDTY